MFSFSPFHFISFHFASFLFGFGTHAHLLTQMQCISNCWMVVMVVIEWNWIDFWILNLFFLQNWKFSAVWQKWVSTNFMKFQLLFRHHRWQHNCRCFYQFDILFWSLKILYCSLLIVFRLKNDNSIIRGIASNIHQNTNAHTYTRAQNPLYLVLVLVLNHTLENRHSVYTRKQRSIMCIKCTEKSQSPK